MSLINNVGSDTSCRVLIETLNILPLSCIYVCIYIYIMDTLYCIEMNIVPFEQNSGMIVIHGTVEIFNPCLGLTF